MRRAFCSCCGAILGVALFGGISNVLMLTGAFFTLEGHRCGHR